MRSFLFSVGYLKALLFPARWPVDTLCCLCRWYHSIVGRTAGGVGGVLTTRRRRCVDRARVERRAAGGSPASCVLPRLMSLRRSSRVHSEASSVILTFDNIYEFE